VIVTGIYISDISEKVTNKMIEISVIVALILVVLTFIAYKIIGTVIALIEQIQAVMAKVEAGDITQRLEINHSNELGLLSHSINSMCLSFII
jgi:nitrate/nitrite-specific signal transduction histidine kinase